MQRMSAPFPGSGPILSAAYPGYDDSRITDQLRADAFIKELKEYEDRPR